MWNLSRTWLHAQDQLKCKKQRSMIYHKEKKGIVPNLIPMVALQTLEEYHHGIHNQMDNTLPIKQDMKMVEQQKRYKRKTQKEMQCTYQK